MFSKLLQSISNNNINKRRNEEENLKIVSYGVGITKKAEYWATQFMEYTRFSVMNGDGSLYTFVVFFRQEVKDKEKILKFLKESFAYHITPNELLAGMILFFGYSSIGFQPIPERKTLLIYI